MSITRRDLLRAGLAAAGALMLPGVAGRSAAARLPSLRPAGVPSVGPWQVLAGSLHDHSTDSDGDSASDAVVTWLHTHRAELGIDFATLSDHSDFFPIAYSAAAADPWARQAALQQRFSGADFSFLRGFEWTNDQQNHLNVLLSSQWTSRFTTGDAWSSMLPFWRWLAAPETLGGGDGIGQFNHPGDKGALNWDDYALDADAAARMCTIEIHGAQDRDGRLSSDAGWYWFALSQGWHVSPVMNWDWHDWSTDGVLGNERPGADYGTPGHLPGQRTLLLAADATPGALRAALTSRRTSASETPDLWATLRARPGHGGPDVWQGGEVPVPRGGSVRIVVDAGSTTEGLTRIDLVGDNGMSPYPHYYGDNDWTSPHSQLTPSYLVQHERFVASSGHATRKARVDAPPDGTVLATAPVDDSTRTRAVFDVALPQRPSPRPDGKHFVYAVAYAGNRSAPARCWTAPLLLNPDVAAG